MLDHYYSTERPLPGSVEQIERIAGAHTEEEREAVAFVLGAFFKHQPSIAAYINRRADAIIEDQAGKTQKARERAEKAAKARWGNAASNATSIPQAMLEQCHPETRSQNTINTPLPPKGDDLNTCSTHVDPKPKTYKQWNIDDLLAAVRENNTDNLLTEDQARDFAEFWIDEKDAAGKSRLWRQKTWSTRMRMQTAKKMIYSGAHKTRATSANSAATDAQGAPKLVM
jgi:uncharacterized protein YdaU (DUF1376 family)